MRLFTVYLRYRSMPTFGRDAIRRFINNVSEMKQLAARNFEDLLQVSIGMPLFQCFAIIVETLFHQCAIPVFEGLLPSPHNDRVMKLLYTFGRWHGFAKLQLHTDHTLEMLDNITVQLGKEMRAFVEKTCTKFDTTKLPHEYQAQQWRESRKGKGKAAMKPSAPTVPSALQTSDTTPSSELFTAQYSHRP